MYISKQKQTHRYWEQTSGCQWGEGRGGQERGMGLTDANYIYKTKISKKDILYSTGKYSHYFVITLNGV